MWAMMQKFRIRAGSVRPADVTCSILSRAFTAPEYSDDGRGDVYDARAPRRPHAGAPRTAG
jgi:hypothetical protein